MTPWELVKKSEHSHQRAVFAFANCAALYGFWFASQPEAYKLEERILHRIVHKREYEPVPELTRLFAIHNQGHGDKIRGAQAKAEGVKPGVPDMCLPVVRLVPSPPPLRSMVNRPGLYIELKRLKGGVVSDDQTDWAEYLAGQGYRVGVAVGWVQAANIIAEYMGSDVRVS